MKRISHRSIFVWILLGTLLLGLAVFAVRYLLQGNEWAVFPGNPHAYIGTNLSAGLITDRDGTMLLDHRDGRTYSSDTDLRRAVMHLLGDSYGYISAPLMRSFADELVGYSRGEGLYQLIDLPNTGKLTISAEVQKVALEALKGRKGTIGVYNYKTGEILCAVTSPTYDPMNIPDIENDKTGAYEGVYLNRFFQTTYVPGSIYKIVTAVAAIETLDDIFQRTFQCDGSCLIGDEVIQCNGVHGTVTFQKALAHSCNVAFGQLAAELGKETMTAYAEKLGITSSLDVDGILTAKGHYDVQEATTSQLAWSGIGQHTNLVNACQYMYLMGMIGGDGVAAKPYLMQEVSDGLRIRYLAETAFSEALISDYAAEKLKIMMNYNVVTMYGADLFPDEYPCAKSGTAELGPGETPNATFAGFLASEEYPLAFIVIVEHGGSGSAACAPIAGRVLRACVQVMDGQ